MKRIRRANLIGGVGLVVAATGACAAPTSDSTSSVNEALEVEPTGAEQRGQTGAESTQHEGEHLGVLGLIADGLSKVGLKDEQREQVEELGQNVRPQEEAVKDARRKLHTELANQLRSGQIDERELDDEIDSLVRAREAASPALREALQDLHGILDERQREELANAVTDRMQEHSRDAEGWFDEFAEDLQLTEEQKPRVREVLERAKPAREQEREKAEEIFEAFKGDTFSMNELVPVEQVGNRERDRARGMIEVAKELSTILTREQRATLADRLEQRQQGGGGEQTGQEQEMPGQLGPEQGQGTEKQPTGQTQSPIVYGRGGGYRAGGGAYRVGGYRTGYVGGWSGGYSAGRTTVVRGGYSTGYPFVGGYGPGIW